MNRGYSREEYITLIDNIKKEISCAISMDMITGCGKTEEDHKDTLSLMDYVKYEYGYMFKYSERPNTPISRMEDDIPDEIKQRRLSEIIEKQMNHSLLRNKEKVGNSYEVLIEGISKDQKTTFMEEQHITQQLFSRSHKKGDLVMVNMRIVLQLRY